MVENPSREKQNLESSFPLPSGDPSEQLVRHFLIETGPKGVKIKGCPSEPYFGEKQGWGRLHLAFQGGQEVSGGRWRTGGISGHLESPLASPLQAACQPWSPSIPSHHCPCPAACAFPAKVGVWVIHPPPSPLPLGPKAESLVLAPCLHAFPWDCRGRPHLLGLPLPADPRFPQILWRRSQRPQCPAT